jgi:membrane protein required for colicin V production
MTLTMYDALMLLIVIFAVIQGAWRGMVWQIAPIASLVLGYIVAYPMSAKTAHYFGQPPSNRLFAMVAIYLAVSLAVYLLVRSVRESLERLKLVEFDRHLGAVLGGVKGVLFTVVITVGLLWVSPQARPLILPSETRTIAAQIVSTISPILPPDIHKIIKPYIDTLHDGQSAIVGPIDEIGNEMQLFAPTKSTARRDNLAKPKHFDEDDGFVPPGTDLNESMDFTDEPLTRPSTRPSSRPESLPEFTVPDPTEPDDFFNADPDRALQSAPKKRTR